MLKKIGTLARVELEELLETKIFLDLHVKAQKKYTHRNNSATVNYYTSSDVLFNQVVILLQDSGFMPYFKQRKNLLNICGYEQLGRLKSIFLGEKAKRLKAYIENNRKIIPNKTFKSYEHFTTTKIKEITCSKEDKVYSMEVSDTNTFVTSYGILAHNCIPIDPIYLSWKARGHGFEARFIDLASHVNSQMPDHVVEKITDGLNRHKKPLKRSKVLVIGVAYKKDVKDLRESPALEIMHIRQKKGAIVSYPAPSLPYLEVNGINLRSVRFTEGAFRDADCVVIVTDHSNVDYGFIVKYSRLIVDTRNALKGVTARARIIRL